MKTIELITNENKYNIHIGRGIVSLINKYMDKYDKVMVLTNDTISSIYREKIEKTILKENLFLYSLPDGEEYKNIENTMEVITFMLENGFTRKSLIVSIGGGVVCDMGGFTASIFMRGIDFIQVPTSLLAQVDASIGGKTGVNHPMGKNIIGSFNQPEAVIIDVDFLETLPKKEFLSGMGEIIKHSIIEQGDSYINFLRDNSEKILKLDKETLIEMIEKSCYIKKEIVEQDEKEKGIRAFLNLGHTYSHALETVYKYKNISHGEGVSKGIIFQFLIGEKLGLIDKSERKKLEDIFSRFGIDCKPVYIINEKLIETMKRDKKNSFDKINFILKEKDGLIMKNICETTVAETNEILVNSIEKRYIKSIIDIGTNSCRLLVCEVNENVNGEIEIVKKLHKETQITRLGKYVDSTNTIKEEGISKVVDIIKRYKEISDEYGSKEIVGFATAATREASNRDVFLQRILTEAKVSIICISGETEAEYTFLGAINELDKDILLFDIGGGSTEIIFGNKDRIEFLKSFKAGAIRESKTFFENDNYDRIEECRDDLRNRLREIISLKNKDFTLVGVAGTVTTNVSVKEKMINYNSEKVHGYILHRSDLEKNLKRFLSLDLESRKKIEGLQPERAESVISGTIITLIIMDMVEKDEIFISEWDNLEGAAVKLKLK